MSGDNYYFGDSVTIRGGQHHTGIIKNQPGAADSAPASAALQSAVEDLLRLVEDLRDRVQPVSAEAIDASLADLKADSGAAPPDRHRALMAIAGIATTVGAVGQPVIEAVNKILDLLGGR